MGRAAAGVGSALTSAPASASDSISTKTCPLYSRSFLSSRSRRTETTVPNLAAISRIASSPVAREKPCSQTMRGAEGSSLGSGYRRRMRLAPSASHGTTVSDFAATACSASARSAGESAGVSATTFGKAASVSAPIAPVSSFSAIRKLSNGNEAWARSLAPVSPRVLGRRARAGLHGACRTSEK